MAITRRQALVGPAAVAAAATIPGIPQTAATAPADVACMTTEQLLAERRAAVEDVWRVIYRHNDICNELTHRGLDPHQDEPDYRRWKRV